MGYVDQHLLPDEKIIFRTKLHWREYFKGFVILLIGLGFLSFNNGIAVSLVIIGIVFIGNSYLKINFSEFAVINKRVLIKVDLLKTSSLETMLNMIDGIYIEQGIIGKVANSGSIVIRGIGGTPNSFHSIA